MTVCVLVTSRSSRRSAGTPAALAVLTQAIGHAPAPRTAAQRTGAPATVDAGDGQAWLRSLSSISQAWSRPARCWDTSISPTTTGCSPVGE